MRDHIKIWIYQRIHLTEEQKLYNLWDKKFMTCKALQYILVVCNYSMYRLKLKKFYDAEFRVSAINVIYSFINRIKLRIICDHRRLDYPEFIKIWDRNNNHHLFSHNNNSIISWNF